MKTTKKDKMENNLNKMEDDLNKKWKWKTTSFFLWKTRMTTSKQMENNLKKIKMEDELKKK